MSILKNASNVTQGCRQGCEPLTYNVSFPTLVVGPEASDILIKQEVLRQLLEKCSVEQGRSKQI